MQEFVHEYEEIKTLPPFWSWVALVIFVGGLLSLGLMSHMLIREGPRHWDFGFMASVPAETRYTTFVPSSARRPAQMRPLPEWRPVRQQAGSKAGF